MSEIWTKKDGTKIAVKDMDDKHIKNTINMLQKKLTSSSYYANYPANKFKKWIDIFEEELSFRSKLESKTWEYENPCI